MIASRDSPLTTKSAARDETIDSAHTNRCHDGARPRAAPAPPPPPPPPAPAKCGVIFSSKALRAAASWPSWRETASGHQSSAAHSAGPKPQPPTALCGQNLSHGESSWPAPPSPERAMQTASASAWVGARVTKSSA